MVQKINLRQKFNMFSERWSPKVVGELNENHIKLVKVQGEFEWHHHKNEDEMFLVVKGSLLIKLRDQDIYLEEGEMVVIPKGVDHLPIAEKEAHLLLVEPKSTLNTGNVKSNRTVAKPEWI